MSLKTVIAIVDDCLNVWDYLNAYYLIFGILAEEIPDHISLGNKLLEQRKQYQSLQLMATIRGGTIIPANERDLITAYEQTLRTLRSVKRNWDTKFIKVLCSEIRFREIALEVKEQGSVAFPKSEVEKLFNLQGVLPFWDSIPDYTVFHLGAGIRMESPEFDMFEALCWSHDETVRTHDDFLECQKKVTSGSFDDEDLERLPKVKSHHALMCRQTVLNSFLFVESFLNSQAYLCLSNSTRTFTPEERLFLSEKTIDPRGNEKVKFVSIMEKLHGWTKIISPRNVTFDKGRNPYQAFAKIKEYRDAVVHLSSGKISRLKSINYDVALEASLTAIEVIKQFSVLVSSDPNKVQYPWWLKERGKDELFHLSNTVTLSKKQD